MKKLISIEWKAKVDDKEYGSVVMFNDEDPSNDKIREMSKIVNIQIRMSLQRIINGEVDYSSDDVNNVPSVDIMMEGYEKPSNN